MTTRRRIALFILIVVAFFTGYLLFARNPHEVQAPSEFRGPSGPPSIEGPEGLPPKE